MVQSPASDTSDEITWRTRAFAPKVRTGCATCKSRRVKCDEQKPECLRCVKAKRKCVYPGSESTKNGGIVLDGRSALVKFANRSFHKGINPLASIMTPDESRSYQYFHEKTKFEVVGYFKSGFWETLVFQASTTNHAVRNAILSLAASHEQVVDSPKSLQQFAMTRYSAAAKEIITSQNRSDSIQTTLICCLLFICFELWQNNFWQAIKHLENGLVLLKETQYQTSIDSSIIDSFIRLDLQLSSMMPDREPTLCDCDFVKKVDPNVIELFKGEEEARISFDYIRMSIMKFTKTEAKPFQRQNKHLVPAHLLAKQRTLLNHLQLWGAAFDTFYQTAINVNETTSSGIYTLAIWHRFMTIFVGTYFSVYDEFDYFNYNAHFDDIVTLAALLRNLPTVDKLLESETTLSCDMNLMQPLFVTAIKCRKPATRAMAVALMRSIPLREGTWFTQQVADLAMQMIKAEEDGTMNYVPDRSALIPLCARVVDTTIQDFALNGSDATGNKKMMEIVTMCEICLKSGENQMDCDDWVKEESGYDKLKYKYVCGHTWN